MTQTKSKKSNLGTKQGFFLTKATKPKSHYLANNSKAKMLQKSKLNKVTKST